MDMELCVPIDKLCKDIAPFCFRMIEPVPIMACTMVYGDFSNIKEAYIAFAEWLQKNRRYDMNDYQLKSIGTVSSDDSGAFIELEPEYIPGLQALEGFSHINIIWWFSDCDNQADRNILQTEQPYKNAPAVMGVFATRSPAHPNPIALTTSEIISIDFNKGIIQIAFIDANDNTPVLDIKPYTPSLDRVETPSVPVWCSEWPKSTEASGSFHWEQVFNF